MKRHPGMRWILLFLLPFLASCGDQTQGELRLLGDRFFLAVQREDFAQANRYMISALSEPEPATRLKNFLTISALAEPVSYRWESADAQEQSATLKGYVATAGQAQEIPIKLNFRFENEQWKISGIERGVQVGDAVLYAPTVDQGDALARRTTAAFAEAVANRDLKPFHASTSERFKDTYPLETFEQAFGGFIRDRTNLAPAASLAAVFRRPPYVSPNGELLLDGHFPTRPSQVRFSYRYLWENEVWVLSGISVQLVPGS